MRIFRIWFLFTISVTYTQAQSIDALVEEIMESMAETQTNESPIPDYQSLSDALLFLFEHPLNINQANESDFKKLLFLNDLQIQNLINYRRQYGAFVSLYELQAIDGFDRQTIRYLLPFVTLKQNENATHSKLFPPNYHHRIIIESHRILQTQAGCKEPSKCLGNPFRHYIRYSGNRSQKWFWNFTAEKDPGEPYFYSSQMVGLDFYSAHLFFQQKKGILRKAIIGDYQLQFGQGLTLWSSTYFGKSTLVLNTMKTAGGLKPYGSVEENRFFRGIATTCQLGKTLLTLFYSDKYLDARIEPTIRHTNDTLQAIIQTTGYHRTVQEWSAKHKLRLRVLGGHATFYRKNHLKLGLTAIHYRFSHPLTMSDLPYRKYRFAGIDLSNMGIDYQYAAGSIYGFGEIAASNNGGLATLHGTNISLASNLMLSLLYRYYSINYQSIYTAPFGESSLPENENGFYAGVVFSPMRYWTLSAYIDEFKFPWLRYGIDAPSTGYDYLVVVNFTPSAQWDMHWKYRIKKRCKNDILTTIVSTKTTHYRWHINWYPSESITLKTRLAWSVYTQEKIVDQGFLFYQDIVYRFPDSRLSFAGRFALFQTDSYNTRLYAYENDILYAFSVPAYFGEGKRIYGMIKYNFSKKLTAWLRIGTWFYPFRSSLSSGINEIQGSTKTTVKCQMRYKF